MVWALKVPPGLHPLVDIDSSFDICFPCEYHADVIAGWAASPVYTRSAFIQLGRLEQCESNFLLKETTTPKCLEQESNLQPFN